MRKIIILCLLCMGSLIQNVQSQTMPYTCGQTTHGTVNYTPDYCTTHPGNDTYDIVYDSYYLTQAAALARAEQALLELKAAYPNYQGVQNPVLSGGSAFGFDGRWNGYIVNVSACLSSSSYYAHGRYIAFLKPYVVDQNNDCNQDTIENDCNNTFYHVNMDVKDSTGNTLYAEVVNSNGSMTTYGDPGSIGECLRKEIGDCTVNYYNQVNYDPETGEGDWNPANDMCGIETDLGQTQTPEGTTSDSQTPPAGEKGTDGQAGSPTDTDLQALDKIADNTMETANNTDGLQETANSIESQLKLANDKLQKIAEKEQQQNNNETPTNSTVQKIGNLDTASDDAAGSEENYEFTNDDVEEPTAIGNILENIKDNNPITAFLSKVSITSADPACAINGEIEFMSQPIEIEFSLCEWEVWIDFMGMIIYMLAVIYFLMLIFG